MFAWLQLLPIPFITALYTLIAVELTQFSLLHVHSTYAFRILLLGLPSFDIPNKKYKHKYMLVKVRMNHHNNYIEKVWKYLLPTCKLNYLFQIARAKVCHRWTVNTCGTFGEQVGPPIQPTESVER